MPTLESLKKTRAVQRRKFSRQVKQLRELLANDEIDKDEISIAQQMLATTYAELVKSQQEILEIMIEEEADEEELDEDGQAADDYEKQFRSLNIRARKLIANYEESEQGDSGSTMSLASKQRNFRLPKIELKKFSGNLKDWLGWWSQFEKIHLDNSLHTSDKFHYLVQAMVPGSGAKELVDSYPVSADNYEKTIKSLKERYGRDKLQRQVYVRELIRMIVENNRQAKETKKLAHLYYSLESHLRALETLKVKSEQMAEFLFPMVESAIPEDILIAWQRSSLYNQANRESDNELQRLMEFLKLEVQAEEQRNLAQDGFGFGRKNQEDRNQFQQRKKNDHTPTAASLTLTTTNKCLFCSKSHESKDCIIAQDFSLEEKRNKVQDGGACYCCLKAGHSAKHCKVPCKCLICSRRHQAIMCPELKQEDAKRQDSKKDINVILSGLEMSSQILLQTVLVKITGPMGSGVVRCLLDSGAQRSYVTKAVVEKLGLTITDYKQVRHVVFGGSSNIKKHGLVSTALQALNSNFRLEVDLMVQEQICGHVPRLCKGALGKELGKNGIYASDQGTSNAPIGILLGSDYLGYIISGNNRKVSDGLWSISTRFGWALYGEIRKGKLSTDHILTMTLTAENESDLWDLEAIGIKDLSEQASKKIQDMKAIEKFEATMRRASDGRYIVILPWVDRPQKIPGNKHIAKKRLEYAIKKLQASGNWGKYDRIFKEWQLEGVIEEVPKTEWDAAGYYMPHRPVIKLESTTTPIRPVFDASCKTAATPSLNDCLEKGANLCELVTAILHRFRKGCYGVVADIKKAFLQIEIDSSDRDFLRFLWVDEVRQEKIFRHCRVVFGVNCSPFILGAVIRHHLGVCEVKFPKTVAKLKESFYVDNCVTSLDTVGEVQQFKEESIAVMEAAKMELRSWEYSDEVCKEICEDVDQTTTTKVLGLAWRKNSDTLSIQSISGVVDSTTKRAILGVMSRIYDPLGIVSPALVLPKLLLQEAWEKKVGWDDVLPVDIQARFQKWLVGVDMLGEIEIPRYLSHGKLGRSVDRQVHVFVDACKWCYAAVIYFREKSEKVIVSFVVAKCRIAPIKKPTIPRMELLACVIGARLYHSVMDAWGETNIPVTFWSDSTTALAWIRRNDEWGTFVGNRVREIRQLTESKDWRYVRGKSNPADLPSRGCLPMHLSQTDWVSGPAWLYEEPQSWPSEKEKIDEDVIQGERKMIVLTGVMESPYLLPAGWKHSSFNRNLRIFAWIRRFVSQARKITKLRGPLSSTELEIAEKLVWKAVQNSVKPLASSNGLVIWIDEEGLQRVKTQLVYGTDEYGFRLPVLLPNQHPIVHQKILEIHEKNGHAGTQYIMGKIREDYWVTKSRQTINRIVRKCIVCRRFNAKPVQTAPAPLPIERFNAARTFEVVGVDLAGPLYLKERTKVWVVLFTCATFRCVHLELADSLSTEEFLLAFERFIARRGRPRTVYSDNGKNFVGAHNLLQQIDWVAVQEKYGMNKIIWKFNPPAAPWWGGWWERLIRIMKEMLRKILGRTSLNRQELSTVLCQVEALMNERPLTYISNDSTELIPLTPAMFLRTQETLRPSELKSYGGGTEFQKRFKYQLELERELQVRFRREYLAMLKQKMIGNGGTRLKVGDIVLIGCDNKKRLDWPLARVEEVCAGRDGECRVARLRTANGTLTRPFQRLFSLEVSQEGDEANTNFTKAGRLVIPPKRLGYE